MGERVILATSPVAIGDLPSSVVTASLTDPLGLVSVKNPTYGAKGDGITDDTAAIQAAITAAAPTAATVILPPGSYRITAPLIIGPYSPASTVPVPYPSLVSFGKNGQIGDLADVSSTQIICDATAFPVGEAAIQVKAPNNTYAPSGMRLGGFALDCNLRAAGVYIEQPREFAVEELGIINAARYAGITGTVPNISGSGPNGATGAFSVVQINSTAAAYSHFSHITTTSSAIDGIVHLAADDSVYESCWDLNSARYGFGVFYVRLSNGHYEKSNTAMNVQVGNAPTTVSNMDYFGEPTDIGLRLVAGPGDTIPALITGCRIVVSPVTGSPTATAIFLPGGNPVNASFVGCEITLTGSLGSWWVANQNSGGRITFDGCQFRGTPTQTGVLKGISDPNHTLSFRNCPGINPVGPLTAPTIPTSGTALSNPFPVDCDVFVTGGTVSAIAIGGTATGLTSGAFRVPAFQTITLTYTAAPTWTWFGD